MLSDYRGYLPRAKPSQGSQFGEIGEVLGAAQCPQCLGLILSLQKKHVEALYILHEAREQFVAIGSRLGIAMSLLIFHNVMAL